MIPGLITPDSALAGGGHVDPDSPAGIQPDGQPSGWTLTMSEEFNGTKQVVDEGQGWVRFRDGGNVWRGWFADYHMTSGYFFTNFHSGNADPGQQYYSLDGISTADGSLLLTAQWQADPQRYAGFRYVSGMIQAQPSFNQTYGYFEARMKLPGGPVQWPAFWAFPREWDLTKHIELDVMECFMQTVQVHHSNQQPGHTVHMHATNVGDVRDWHTYGMAWYPDRVEWYVDGVLQVTETNAAAVPQVPMYPIVNLATRATSGTYPETLVVETDYVRIWQAT